jgi:hypothetical protein
MSILQASERLKIYTRYIGQKVILIDPNAMVTGQVGLLSGIKTSGIQVTIDGCNRWVPLYDDFQFYEVKLLLKPLSKLTESIKQTANNLPVQTSLRSTISSWVLICLCSLLPVTLLTASTQRN